MQGVAVLDNFAAPSSREAGSSQTAHLELVNSLDSSLVLVSVPGRLLLSLSQPVLQLTQRLLPLRVGGCVLPSVLLYLLL